MLKDNKIYCDWCDTRLHPTGEPFRISEVKRINRIITVDKSVLDLCDTCYKRGLPEDCSELDYDYENPNKNPTRMQRPGYSGDVYKCDSFLINKLIERFTLHEPKTPPPH